MPAEVGRLVTLLALERLASAARFQQKARNDERERVALWPIDEHAPPEDVIFCSSEMTTWWRARARWPAMTINVLVTGETGTGKEMIARVIHGASPRASRPFVPFNCTAVPKDLVDSQLFGHRKGAFTGAVADHPGVIRAAAGGTLYLDEIGDLGLDVQPKLLRFLESGEIQPLGEPRPQKVDVRIIASTNRNLDRLVAEGLFRADLFYRLNVVPLRLPPLRERREEVPPLAEHFLNRAAREFGKDRLQLAEETMEYLVLYRWPGNVRQLANEMRRLAAMAEPGAVLMPEHLDPAITAGRRTVPVDGAALMPTEVVVRLDQPHAALIEHAERAQIRYAMAQCGGRVETPRRCSACRARGCTSSASGWGWNERRDPPRAAASALVPPAPKPASLRVPQGRRGDAGGHARVRPRVQRGRAADVHQDARGLRSAVAGRSDRSGQRRIHRTLLIASMATITVDYGPRHEVPWMPVTMEERYERQGVTISGKASYSKFRRFQVTTTEQVTLPKK